MPLLSMNRSNKVNNCSFLEFSCFPARSPPLVGYVDELLLPLLSLLLVRMSPRLDLVALLYHMTIRVGITVGSLFRGFPSQSSTLLLLRRRLFQQ